MSGIINDYYIKGIDESIKVLKRVFLIEKEM